MQSTRSGLWGFLVEICGACTFAVTNVDWPFDGAEINLTVFAVVDVNL